MPAVEEQPTVEEQPEVPADWDCPDDPPPADVDVAEDARVEQASTAQEVLGEPPSTAQESTQEPAQDATPPKARSWLDEGHTVAESNEDLKEKSSETATGEPGLAPTQPKSASPTFHAVPDEGVSKASASIPLAMPLSKAACGPPPQSQELHGVTFTEEGASKAAAVARHDASGAEPLAVAAPHSADPQGPPPPPHAGGPVAYPGQPALAGMPVPHGYPPLGYPPHGYPPHGFMPQFPHGAPAPHGYAPPCPYPPGHPMSRPPHYPAPPGAYPGQVGAPPGAYPGQAVRPPIQAYGAPPQQPPGILAPMGSMPAGPPPGIHHSRPPAAWVGTRPSSPTRKESHHKSKKDKHDKHDKHHKHDKHGKHDKKKKHGRKDSSPSRSRSRQRRRASTRQPSPVPLQPSRPTPPARPTGYNVFISNIPPDLTAVDLAEALTDVSEQRIEAVDLFRDAQGFATGEALVVFASYADACNSVARYHGGDLNGRKLNVVLRP